MTSRDIEVTLGKSREHVSRLMKKLFEDGFVGRDTSIRPYRYTITEKGRERIGSDEGQLAVEAAAIFVIVPMEHFIDNAPEGYRDVLAGRKDLSIATEFEINP